MNVQQQIQQPYLKKFKMEPTTLSTIACNASTAFSVGPLSAFANLSNQFFKFPSSFGGKPPIVEIVIERAVRIEKMAIPCSRNKVRILSAKDVF